MPGKDLSVLSDAELIRLQRIFDLRRQVAADMGNVKREKRNLYYLDQIEDEIERREEEHGHGIPGGC